MMLLTITLTILLSTASMIIQGAQHHIGPKDETFGFIQYVGDVDDTGPDLNNPHYLAFNRAGNPDAIMTHNKETWENMRIKFFDYIDLDVAVFQVQIEPNVSPEVAVLRETPKAIRVNIDCHGTGGQVLIEAEESHRLYFGKHDDIRDTKPEFELIPVGIVGEEAKIMFCLRSIATGYFVSPRNGLQHTMRPSDDEDSVCPGEHRWLLHQNFFMYRRKRRSVWKKLTSNRVVNVVISTIVGYALGDIPMAVSSAAMSIKSGGKTVGVAYDSKQSADAMVTLSNVGHGAAIQAQMLQVLRQKECWLWIVASSSKLLGLLKNAKYNKQLTTAGRILSKLGINADQKVGDKMRHRCNGNLSGDHDPNMKRLSEKEEDCRDFFVQEDRAGDRAHGGGKQYKLFKVRGSKSQRIATVNEEGTILRK